MKYNEKSANFIYIVAYYFQMVPKNYKIHCHCFTGTYESAKKWMDMFPNLFIGLTPLVTYRTATSTHEVARFIPLERLLLETDAPYFVPRKVWCNNIDVVKGKLKGSVILLEEFKLDI